MVPSNSSSRDGNGQHGNGAMGAKEGKLLNQVFNMILISFVEHSHKRTDYGLFFVTCYDPGLPTPHFSSFL